MQLTITLDTAHLAMLDPARRRAIFADELRLAMTTITTEMREHARRLGFV